jgi:hypothetical protein
MAVGSAWRRQLAHARTSPPVRRSNAPLRARHVREGSPGTWEIPTPSRQSCRGTAERSAIWLHEAYRRTRKDGATGVDRQTAEEYAANLEGNLRSLLDRAKSGTDRVDAPEIRDRRRGQVFRASAASFGAAAGAEAHF